MQLGVIGLGRMGGNIARRLMAGGHQCVVYDRDPAAVAKLAQDGAAGARDLEDLVGQLARAPRRLGDAAGRRADRRHRHRARRAAGARRHRHRRRQHLLPGRHPPGEGAERQGHRLCRRRHLRRRLGPGARLLHDGRRRRGGRRAPRSDPRRPWRPGRATSRAPAGPRGRDPRAEQGYIHAGPGGRRPLRQDGPQRHRVRPDAGLCRRLRHPAQSKAAEACRRTSASISTSPTSPRSGGAAA